MRNSLSGNEVRERVLRAGRVQGYQRSNPSSGPRRLVRTPVAGHLLPWGEGKMFFLAAAARRTHGRAVARNTISPLRRGEGGSRHAFSPAGASRVRGYFFALSATVPIASTTFRTNSSGCSRTMALGMRNTRMPRDRK